MRNSPSSTAPTLAPGTWIATSPSPAGAGVSQRARADAITTLAMGRLRNAGGQHRPVLALMPFLGLVLVSWGSGAGSTARPIPSFCSVEPFISQREGIGATVLLVRCSAVSWGELLRRIGVLLVRAHGGRLHAVVFLRGAV